MIDHMKAGSKELGAGRSLALSAAVAPFRLVSLCSRG